jgi:hypothetical protein
VTCCQLGDDFSLGELFTTRETLLFLFHFGREALTILLCLYLHYMNVYSMALPKIQLSTKKSTIYQRYGAARRRVNQGSWIEVHYWVGNKWTEGGDAVSWPPQFDPGNRVFRTILFLEVNLSSDKMRCTFCSKCGKQYARHAYKCHEENSSDYYRAGWGFKQVLQLREFSLKVAAR